MTISKFSRRRFLYLAAGAAVPPVVSRTANAQTYPTRPVRWISGTAAGSAPDIVARMMGQWLSERLGQPFVIENRPGAGTNIGTEVVARALPDGYSLLLVTQSNAFNATLYEHLNFNFINDIVPVASISRGPLIMEVNPSVPVKSVLELIDYARGNPGKLNMASAGNGTPQHVAGELFKMMAGVSMLHVPYRGSPFALTALIAGEVQVMFDTMPASIGHIKAGEIRPLAVTTTARSELLPKLPTVGDFVPGYEASSWYGVGAPTNTPAEIIDRLNKEINAGLADPKMKTRLADLGVAVVQSSPAEFGKFIADETEKWGRVIRAANIKPE